MSNVIEYKVDDILKKLPKSWSDVTLDDFINKMLTLEVSEDEYLAGYENVIALSSLYLGLDVSIINEFPISVVRKMMEQFSFLNEKPKPLKRPKYKPIIEIDEISYDTFILFTKVSEQVSNKDYSNFPLLIRQSCKIDIPMDDIMKMPMDEVENLFFFLRKALMKYLAATGRSYLAKILMMSVKGSLMKIKKKMPLKRTSKSTKTNIGKSTGGTS